VAQSGGKWQTDAADVAGGVGVLAAPARAGFCGTYRHSVDAKGRVAMPAALRRELPEGSFVARGPDHRLVVMTPDGLRAEVARFVRTAETPAQRRHFERIVRGGAYPVDLDDQGRLLLTSAQRQWAQIGDRAVFVGMGPGIEIAGEERWQAEATELDPDEYSRLHDLVHSNDEPGEIT